MIPLIDIVHVLKKQIRLTMFKLSDNHFNQIPWLTFSVGTLAFALYFLPDHLTEVIQYTRSDVASGSVWRVLTGHFVHWNFEHLIVDLAVFLVIGSMVELRSRKSWILVNLSSALLISLSVYVLRSNIELYRGLSGVDMALASFWIIDSLVLSFKSSSKWESIAWGVGLIFIILKPIVEIMLGHPIFVQNLGSAVVGMPVPHILGALVGITSWVIWLFFKRIKPQFANWGCTTERN